MCWGGLERDKPRGETRGRRGVGRRVWDGSGWGAGKIPESTCWTEAPSSIPQSTPEPCHHHPTVHPLDCGTIQHATTHPLDRGTSMPQLTSWTAAQSSMPHPSPRSVAPSCHNPLPGLWHHPACHNPPPGPWMIEIFSRLFSIASYMAMGCLSLIPVGVPLCSDRTKGRPCQGEDATPGRPICRPPENHDFDHF